MRIAYFDCFAGISGDMFIGALLDAGLEAEVLSAELAKLPLTGYRLEFSQVDRGGIRASRFNVILSADDGDRLADSEYIEVEIPGDEGREQGEEAWDTVLPARGEHRTLPQIIEIIASSSLSDKVKTTAISIFNRLAEAESQVHGLSPAEVQFHEVGAVDAILDIVAAAIGLEELSIAAVYASPLHLGTGFVRSQHGLLPVPGPATAYLLQSIPVYTTQAKGELVTPTGAAILSTIALGFGPMPLMSAQSVGYGAGRRDRDFPNVLRVFLGDDLRSPGTDSITADAVQVRPVRDPFPEQHDIEPGLAGYHEGPAMVIEANIDDMSPQLFEHMAERLLGAGALDVIWVPAQMKKGRPGVHLQVLAHPDSVDYLLAVIFMESTSIGARTYPVTKRMLQREILVVQTPFGAVRTKIAWLGDKLVNISPEYEDCRQIAQRLNVPLKEIFSAAVSAARETLPQLDPEETS